VRPVFAASKNTGDNIISAVFFISFVLICSVVLLNVVVAVLLDGMSSAGDSEQAEQSKDALAKGELDAVMDDLNGSTMTPREEMAQMRAKVQDMAADLREVHAVMKRLTERQCPGQ